MILVHCVLSTSLLCARVLHAYMCRLYFGMHEYMRGVWTCICICACVDAVVDCLSVVVSCGLLLSHVGQDKHRAGQAAPPQPAARPGGGPPPRRGLQQKWSHFGDLMMDMRTRSVLSATQVQQIAKAVYKDDGISGELEHLVLMGKGHQGGNCCRACTRFAQRRHALCRDMEPYVVTVPINSDKHVGSDSLNVHVILPHELFSVVFDLFPDLCHELFGTVELAKFWTDESAHRNVPSDIADDSGFVIPVRMYGDDAAHCKTNAFIAVYLMPATSFR